ncbi:hypothetical protein BJX64DRAFT_291200 [Aspergillus heterothallicus]
MDLDASSDSTSNSASSSEQSSETDVVEWNRWFPDIPLEVMDRLIWYLDRPSVFELALVCRHFWYAVRWLVHNRVTVKNRQAESFAAAINSPRYGPRFAGRVHELTIHYHHHEMPGARSKEPPAYPIYAESLSPAIAQLVELRNLNIKGCDWGSDNDLLEASLEPMRMLLVETRKFQDLMKASLRRTALENLQSCKLKLNDYGAWSLSERDAIFLQLSLFELTVVDAEMADFPSFELKHERTTRLYKLALIRCDISPKTLWKVLSVPHALRWLVFVGRRQSYMHAQPNWKLYVDAIAQQKHSLHGLNIDFFLENRAIFTAFSFRDLWQLRELRVKRETLYPPNPLERRAATAILPNSLRVLTVWDDDDDEPVLLADWDNDPRPRLWDESYFLVWLMAAVCRRQFPFLKRLVFEIPTLDPQPPRHFWTNALGGGVQVEREVVHRGVYFVEDCRACGYSLI